MSDQLAVTASPDVSAASSALWIDVHSHFLPEPYLRAMAASGLQDVDGFPLPRWSVDSHLEAMDAAGVQSCLLSISSPGIGFERGAGARDLARSINQAARDIVQSHPRRFGAFAVLPLPDVAGALSEIAHALDVLELDGIGLLSNYDGRYLGDPEFEPVFQEIDRRGATVFVHPTVPPGFDGLKLGLDLPGSAIEYMFDTTRMVASMIGWGRLAQCARMRLIAPHGGGTLPYLWPRIRVFLARLGRQPAGTDGRRVEELVRTLYFDVTFANTAPVLATLRSLVPASQLLAGFDFPFMPAANMSATIRAVGSYAGFSDEERSAVAGDNAKALFPRLMARLAA
jgi:predicted TIM-barrel fold metal-dependent hydrolase